MKTVNLYSHFGQSNGCFHHRVLWPLRYVQQDFPEHNFDVSLTDPSKPYDIYYLYNLLTASSVQCCGQWKGKGGKVVVGYDDLLTHIPAFNHCKIDTEALSWMEVAKDVADLVICSTPVLAQHFNRPTKTVVARNLLDVASYQTQEHNPVRDRIRILWSGSATHSGDLEILEPVVDQILTRYSPKQVEFVFVGSAPGGAIKNWLGKGVHMEPGVSLSIYPELLSVIKPQIVLAPLVDCEFNRAKSGIRVMEAGALAAPVVASPVGEYKVFVEEGRTGYLADTTDQWVDRIVELIETPKLREQMGNLARKRAGTEWDWANSDCRTEWRTAIQRALDLCA